MKTTREMKRKGFTLVELLIVIVVIGVLSAMMMLSSTEAVSSARASNIVSNLRNMKTAVLAWYADHLDDAEDLGTSKANALNDKRAEIMKYLNNGDASATEYEHYKFTGNATDKSWYVFYDGSEVSTASGTVNGKLAGRAESVGLFKSASTATAEKYVATATAVYMFIR